MLGRCTLKKVADYFDVSADYLLGSAQTENAPTQEEGERGSMDENLMFALFGSADIDDDLFAEVKRFAQFAKERRGDGVK